MSGRGDPPDPARPTGAPPGDPPDPPAGEGSRARFRGQPAALEWVADGWHLRVVQPYRALKTYRCPGCDQEIFPRTLHVVVWPEGSPEQRRHWHRPCWERHAAELGRTRGRGRRRA